MSQRVILLPIESMGEGPLCFGYGSLQVFAAGLLLRDEIGSRQGNRDAKRPARCGRSQGDNHGGCLAGGGVLRMNLPGCRRTDTAFSSGDMDRWNDVRKERLC